MSERLPRFLLGASAAVLALGGFMHTRAFGKTAAAASALPAYYGGAFKALWLIDSATLLVLALVFAMLAARRSMASGVVVVLLALIPGATAVLLYVFLGRFLPAHLLLGAALMIALAGLQQLAPGRVA
jgi:hypothetical protein